MNLNSTNPFDKQFPIRVATLHMSSTVTVYSTPDMLGAALCNDIKTAAREAIQKKGAFYLAVPGGLKFLCL